MSGGGYGLVQPWYRMPYGVTSGYGYGGGGGGDDSPVGSFLDKFTGALGQQQQRAEQNTRYKRQADIEQSRYDDADRDRKNAIAAGLAEHGWMQDPGTPPTAGGAAPTNPNGNDPTLPPIGGATGGAPGSAAPDTGQTLDLGPGLGKFRRDPNFKGEAQTPLDEARTDYYRSRAAAGPGNTRGAGQPTAYQQFEMGRQTRADEGHKALGAAYYFADQGGNVDAILNRLKDPKTRHLWGHLSDEELQGVAAQAHTNRMKGTFEYRFDVPGASGGGSPSPDANPDQ